MGEGQGEAAAGRALADAFNAADAINVGDHRQAGGRNHRGAENRAVDGKLRHLTGVLALIGQHEAAEQYCEFAGNARYVGTAAFGG